ncbi:MAG: D-alanyl-D-alanine carboxypeptidase [Caloramator sp.]|jgi:D-alanyl-D-alanine carboxypeptidase|uniref:D-alanyl-D-alanine carboxypeptidase family protein n=1 Tax=Caloramator sp. TaxID=1871330 RepID=UPI001DFC8838|nr:D-alanyl-D-alanine carboxypeptidase family protein [Caloramator sp.]MBZ4662376.1 D-alanyl-D-alanine carboxypeptidase [Caloramator sp.]
MKKYLNILYLILIFILCSSYKINTVPTSKKITLNSYAAVVIDQNSGRILYSKNSDIRLPMASTTKIMTTIVALEKGNLNDRVIVSKKAASIGGSNAGLLAGEKISLEELLYGLMLRSGNDAAIAIAEHIGGNVDNFLKLMNEKAIEIGAFNTSFKTPHGLDADGHYTTAEDLAKITAYAMKNDFFNKIVSTKEISAGISGKFNRSYSNINKFLYRVENADGVKTGYTSGAGKCLVASVKHDYGRYICVVLNSSDRWKDAEELVKYAKENYKFIKLFNKGDEIKSLRVFGGKTRYIISLTENDVFIPIKSDEAQYIRTEAFVPSVIFSPIKKGDVLGNLVVYYDGNIIAKYPVVSDRDVDRKNLINTITDTFKSITIK